jgi:hypothetical protein
MYKIKSIKVAFYSMTDSSEEAKELEDDGWELHYLLKPSECPLLKSAKEKIKEVERLHKLKIDTLLG